MNATLQQVYSRPQIKGSVFDMDGTLFNSELGTITLMRDLIFKLKGFHSEVKNEECIGLGYPEKMTKLLGYYDQDMINEAIRLGSVYYSEIAEPIEGVNPALEEIQAMGIKTSIGTNGFMSMLMPTYDKLSIRLDHYQGTDGGLAKKPDPAVFLTAIKALGLEPHEVAIVEDSQSGVDAALAAGVPVENILVFNPYGKGPEGFTTFTSWS